MSTDPSAFLRDLVPLCVSGKKNMASQWLHLCRLSIAFTGVIGWSLLAQAEEKQGQQNEQNDLDAPSIPLIGWSQIISGTEAPIETWIPKSILSVGSQQRLPPTIQQILFEEEEATVLPQPVKVLTAKPEKHARIISVPTPKESVPIAVPAPPTVTKTTETQLRHWTPRTTPVVDPSLCGTEMYRISDQKSGQGNEKYRCGQCASCEENDCHKPTSKGLIARMTRARNRFRQTLLGDANLFYERPFGSSLNAVIDAQTSRGAASQCVLWEFDFDRNPDGSPSAKLKGTSLPRLKIIAETMMDTGTQLVLQASGSQNLDARRREQIMKQFELLGIALPVTGVNVSATPGSQQSGIEAELQFRSRITQGVRGGTSPSEAAASLQGTN